MRNPVLILALAVSALSLGLGIWSWQQWARQQAAVATPKVQSATVLPAPRTVPDFSLTDQAGQPFGRRNLQRRWSLLFFGFTHCPDVCPNTLGLLHAVSTSLKQAQPPAPLQVVFISVDPKRDDTAALKRYVEYFGPAFTAATGPEPELQKLTGALYLPYAYVPTGQGEDYTVEHSGTLVLVNPKGEAVAYFSPPHELAALVADLRALLQS